MEFIIKWKNKSQHHSRSDMHKILKDEGWGGAGLTDEQADKCKYLEKKAKNEGINPDNTRFPQMDIDKVK